MSEELEFISVNTPLMKGNEKIPGGIHRYGIGVF